MYEIINKGVLVKNVKTVNQIVKYFKEEHPEVKGMSTRTLERRLNRDTATHEKGDFKINRYDFESNPNRSKIDEDINRDFIIVNDYEKLDLQDTIRLNGDNYSDITQVIINKLTEKAKQAEKKNDKTTSYSVLIKTDGGITSTPFTNLNRLRNLTDNILYKLFTSYEDTRITEILIRKGELNVPYKRQYMYGDSTENEKCFKKYVAELNSKDSKYTSATITKKFNDILKNYYIIGSDTRYNCLINALFTSLFENTNVRSKVKEFLRSHKNKIDNKNELQNICDYFAYHFNINVTAINKNLETYRTPKLIDCKEIKIFTFGAHAYGMIPKTINNIEDIFKKTDGELIKKKEIKLSDAIIGTYDIETCDEINKLQQKNNVHPYAIGLYIDGVYKEFFECDTVEGGDGIITRMIKSIKQDNVILYAHNGGKFDMWVILNEVLKLKGYVDGCIIKDGRIIQFNFRRINSEGLDSKLITFRDSFTFLSTSLDKLCKEFKTNTQKLTGDVDHDIININNCKTVKIKKYVSKYLENDCKSLYEIITKFNDIIVDKISGNRYTIKECITNAAIARNEFLTKWYRPDKYPLYNMDIETDMILREFYYGGRNECFEKLGRIEGPIYYYDFTSLYPYCLLKDLPYGTPETVKFKNPYIWNSQNYDKKELNKYFGFVHCRVKHINKNKRPYHGIKKDFKLLFPYFENPTELIITTDELKYSLSKNLGYEYEIDYIINYKGKAKYYKPFIDHLYRLKIEAEENNQPILRSTAKIIINSSYGFWGIRRESENIAFFKSKAQDVKEQEKFKYKKLYNLMETERLKDYKEVNGHQVFKYDKELETDCQNVGIAFFTCAYARTKLYDLMNDIEEAGGKTYYCDTDSVMTTLNIEAHKTLSKKYITPEGERIRLGDLTNETGEKEGYYNFLITLGNKIYYLENPTLKKDQYIKKFKGLNIYTGYEKRTVDKVNKIIKFKGIVPAYKQTEDNHIKINYEDYDLLNKGYILDCETMTFRSGTEIIYKEKQVTKEYNDKKFKKQYLKGVYNKEGIDQKIEPFNI